MSTLTPGQLAVASELLESIEKSKFFVEATKKRVPILERAELDTGDILGRGSFCAVNEIKNIVLQQKEENVAESRSTAASSTTDAPIAIYSSNGESNHSESFHENLNGNGATSMIPVMVDEESDVEEDDDDPHGDEEDGLSEQEARKFMETNCIRQGDARYAIKALRPDLKGKKRKTGLIDLAIEAKYLTVITHPNIIKMRGVGSREHLCDGFYIVLDRLYGILSDKLPYWKNLKTLYSGKCMGLCGRDEVGMQSLLSEQLTCVYDLSAAYLYLHNRNIIYRDIKSDNIGFDVRGDVKIFDFGLCTPLDDKKKNRDGLYKLTGQTGSRRYMAPEVTLNKPYNLTADSYSFGILLWEVFATQCPFEDFDVNDHAENVVKRGYRPPIPSHLPISVKDIIRDCWSEKISKRPDFVRIASILRSALMNCTESKQVHNRTEHMMNRSNSSKHIRQL